MVPEEQRQYYFGLGLQAGAVFNPNTPVNEKDLFSGRTSQIRRVTDVIFQRGQHAIIFGERGVGKTSLANVLQDFLPTAQSLLVVRINCDVSDTFLSVWKKVFDGMSFVKTKSGVGYRGEVQKELFSPSVFLKDDENVPHQVYNALMAMPPSVHPVIIIDEFDRLGKSVRPVFADFLKTLSDQAIPATIILIGVGENVSQLISDHQSVSRALVQIQMPRMRNEEIEDIIVNSLRKLDNMTIEKSTLQKIILLAKGLPHYAHLIGLHATRDALDHFSKNITDVNLTNAISKAIQDCQHSIKSDYHNAIRSTRKVSLFEDVLLACALAEVNEMGEFSANSLKVPLQIITGHKYEIPAYAKHLGEFSDKLRGNILLKSGERRKYRYKFADPLMQPFVIMQGMLQGKSME